LTQTNGLNDKLDDTIEVETVLLKVASRCNINCTYCYVFNMGDNGWRDLPRQMSLETIAAVTRALGDLSDRQTRPFAVVLHGGEPLLLGRRKLEYLICSLRDSLPDECSISIQTNGILIDNALLDFCSKTRTTVSVSLDGPKNLHDKNRIGHSGAGTFEAVMNGLTRLRCHPDTDFLFTGLLAVVDPESDPLSVYHFFKELNPPSVDFIYKDGNHSHLPDGKAFLNSVEFGRWMADLVDVYVTDPRPIKIRILDDMIKLMLGGTGSKDGIGVTDYGVLIIDTDGRITKNDTLKSSFDGAHRFRSNWFIQNIDLRDVLTSSEFTEYHRMQRPTAKECHSCTELRICGGGMALHRWSQSNGYDNPSVFCSDQKYLIDHIRRKYLNRLNTTTA